MQVEGQVCITEGKEAAVMITKIGSSAICWSLSLVLVLSLSPLGAFIISTLQMGKGSLGDVLGEALTKPEHKEGIRLGERWSDTKRYFGWKNKNLKTKHEKAIPEGLRIFVQGT